MAERIALYSLEAEMSVLGSMLLSFEAAERASQQMTAEMFYRPGHRNMFTVWSGLTANRVKLDFLIAKEALESANLLQEVGGEDYLVQLAEYTPSAANVEFYIDIVRSKYRLRAFDERLIECRKMIYSGEHSPDDVYAFVGDMQRGLEGSGQDLFLAGDVDLSRGADAWVPCGIRCLDERGIGGGIFPRGHLTMVGALSGQGKTAFLTYACGHLLQQGYRVLYATLEMSRREIKAKIVQTLCGWDKAPRSLDHLPAWDAANAFVDRSKLLIWDPSERDSSGKTVEALQEQVLKLKRTRGLDVVLVDYSQLFDTARRKENRTRELDTVADVLFATAKSLGGPVVAGAQLIAPKNEDPRIADCSKFFKNSALTIFLGIRRPEDDPFGVPTWEGSARIVKTRNGNYAKLPLRFRWKYARFEDPEASLPDYDPFADQD